jgi:non-heme chloroperoxidase
MNEAHVVDVQALGLSASFRAIPVPTADGLTIAAQDWRQNRSGRDVLFIHGNSQSHLCWLKQVASPLAAEFRLATYDLRGHGASDKPQDAHYYREPERWAAEVEGVIHTLGLQQPVIVAWSYGGRVALDYVSCRGDEALGGLVLVNATSKADGSVLGPDATLLRRTRAEDLADNIAATTALLRACTARPPPDEEFRFMLAYNMVVPPGVRSNLAGRHAEYESVLRSLKVPVLAIHGSEDRITLPAMADYTIAQVPNGHRVVYDGIGHMPFWEAPDRFNADLADYLRRVPE